MKARVLAFLTLACGPVVEPIDPVDPPPADSPDAAPLDDPDQPPDLNGCDEDLALQPALPPRFLIVLDRSGSMEEIWAPVTTAIQSVVAGLDAQAWGLGFFPTSDETSPDQCKVDPVSVPVALGNAGPISTAIAATGPYGLTPTFAAIEQAGAYLATLTDANPKYVLLITDGIPNCAREPNCECPPGFSENGASQCVLVGGGPYDYYSCDVTGDLSINATYWAIADLAAQGVRTIVFGLPSFDFTDFGLNVLAPAGGEARPGAVKYYPASNPAELEATLASLSAALVSCTFTLPDDVPGADLIGIEIDGEPVPPDPAHVNGWDYTSAGEVRLYGAWCDLLQSGDHDLQAFFVCPPEE